jgi:tRNA(Ile)-lysidine synthase
MPSTRRLERVCRDARSRLTVHLPKVKPDASSCPQPKPHPHPSFTPPWGTRIKAVVQHDLFRHLPPGRLLLAVSGGRDSLALLHLAQQAGLDVVVGHLDHGLRPASASDAAFVVAQAEALGVTAYSQRLDVARLAGKDNLEATARRLRYSVLAQIAKKAGAVAILTAHTLDDQAETILMQLLRGTGRAIGIPMVRGRIYRPLLGVMRAELTQFLQAHKLTWREDASNQDLNFTRNWLRHAVIPLLRQRFPGFEQRLAQYAEIGRQEDGYLQAVIATIPPDADLRREHPALQRRKLHGLLTKAGRDAGFATDFATVERLRLALAAPKVFRQSLGATSRAVVQQGRLQILDERQPKALLDRADLDFSAFPNATARFRQAGDWMNLTAGRRKLSDILIDRKIPRELRDSISLMAEGQQVLWLGLTPALVDVLLPTIPDPEYLAMRQALALAEQSGQENEVPVGAVVVFEGQIIASGRNRSRLLADMTRHAELEALQTAAQQLGSPYLTACSLVVTLEPCLMCLGAALEARIGRIVYAASNPKQGALGGVSDLLRLPWPSKPTVRGGLLAREAAKLLGDFFSRQRSGL